MKVFHFMIVVLTVVFDANCQNFHSGPMSEVQIFPNGTVNTDYTDEDRVLPIQQFYNNSTDETNRLLIRTENPDTDEEDLQMNQIGDMSMLLGRSRWCRSRGGRCRRQKFACEDGHQASPFGRPYCTSRKRRCCYPDTTTTAPTTITPGCNVTWMIVGADRFASFHLQVLNWTDARDFCRQHCLDLYVPKDAIAVSKLLDDTFRIGGGFEHWLGGRGNGTHQLWFSGNVVPGDAPWSSTSQQNNVATTDCMFLHGHDANTGKVLGGFSCSHSSAMRPLCG